MPAIADGTVESGKQMDNQEKNELRELKQDLLTVLQDMQQGTQQMFQEMRHEMQDMKHEMKDMRQEMNEMRQEVTGIALTIENELRPDIQMLAEGYSSVVKTNNTKVEVLETRVGAVESAVAKNTRDILAMG